MQILEYQLPVPLPDGDVRDCEARIVVSGEDKVLTFVHDITERVRALGQRVLELCGYTVLMAEDGVQGLEVCQAHRGEITLVVLDVIMPQMGRQECLRRLREMDPQVKVLISTGQGQGLGRGVRGRGCAGGGGEAVPDPGFRRRRAGSAR